MPESTRSSRPDAPYWAVILAGGVGSRFWPVSTAARPKQLLPLTGDRSLIEETLARIEPVVPPERTRILTGRHLADLIRRQVPGLSEDQLLLEPRARGTAPALAWAAWRIARDEPRAVMASLHADHAIEPADAFRDMLARVAELATAHDRLFTLGIEPTRPETGYGYIQVGDVLPEGAPARAVADFVEKPDRDTAQEYLRRGGYLWNSGIFVWRVDVFLDQLRSHTPEIAELLPMLEAGDEEGFFRSAPALSVDEGLLERSKRVAVVPASFRWDDVGAWDAVARGRKADPAGNVAVGEAFFHDTRRSIAWSEGGAVVLFGVDDLVVVSVHGATLVMPRERAGELKEVIEGLPEALRRMEESDG
ncbi:MAG TPA: sugar phosphate nucleotidyltransferase [Longimicrobiales bacterium]|nr:sugar phosphate nucleotidyltransferase [Longimicrobiales bacterium]